MEAEPRLSFDGAHTLARYCARQSAMVSPSPQSAAQAPAGVWLTRALRAGSPTQTAETMTCPAWQDCCPEPRTIRNCCC